MKRIVTEAAPVVAVVLSLLLACGKREERPIVWIESARPADFSLPDDMGKTVKLSRFRGKPVVLVFYASWCGACHKEAPHVESDIWQKYRRRGVQVLGVALGESAPDALKAFRKKHGVTYPLLDDASKTTAERFDVLSLPAIIIVDREGRPIARTSTAGQVAPVLDRLLH